MIKILVMDNLPNEIIRHIFKFIPQILIHFSLKYVNYLFYEISKDFCDKKLYFFDLQGYLISILDDQIEINDFEFLEKFKFQIYYDRICEQSALYGKLNLLQYGHENGYPWDEYTCTCTSSNGHLDCLKYTHENGCPWDEDTCSFCVADGYLDCLKYAHENGCPWDHSIYLHAALYGHLDCLQYANENGCPWYYSTCSYAALNGHLDCLKYAHENGCP